MKVSEYIVEYFYNKGIKHVFGYPGGMVTDLMDSLSKHHGINSQLNYNEQGAGFAACSYAQVSKKFGVAYATSGPGATNLITPICHAYFESIPLLVITGQVNRAESKGSLKVRQRGFQETDITSMVKDVTKYSAYIDDPNQIKYHLDKAIYLATSGRPGSVLLDIPIDIFREEVDVDNLLEFKDDDESNLINNTIIKDLENALNHANRPLILLGNGINSSQTSFGVRKFIKDNQIPCVSSMIAIDIMGEDKNLYYGFIGAYGHRAANFVISKCDLLICLGTRLDMRQTGVYKNNFATDAKLIRIDIDNFELENKIKDDENSYNVDLKELAPLLSQISLQKIYKNWINQCNYYKNELGKIDVDESNNWVESLSEFIPENAVITTDVGQNQVWVAQSFSLKQNQRVLFSGGHGAMGVSLPASIGACFVTNSPTYCITGDGGFQMNIQELQVIAREKLPVKIIILNNSSLGMIRHFQEMYYDSRFTGTTLNNGYCNPNFIDIGKAYGIRSVNISKKSQLKKIEAMLIDNESLLVNIMLSDTTYVFPKLEYKRPIYDQDPKLDREYIDTLLSYGNSEENDE